MRYKSKSTTGFDDDDKNVCVSQQQLTFVVVLGDLSQPNFEKKGR